LIERTSYCEKTLPFTLSHQRRSGFQPEQLMAAAICVVMYIPMHVPGIHIFLSHDIID